MADLNELYGVEDPYADPRASVAVAIERPPLLTATGESALASPDQDRMRQASTEMLGADNDAAIAKWQQTHGNGTTAIAQEAAGAARDARSTALINAQQMATAPVSTVRSPNNMFRPVQEHNAAFRDARGRERDATVAGHAAEQEGAGAMRDFYIDERARLFAENQAREDVEFTRQARSHAALEASRAARLQVTKAADALSQAPAEDPDRYWADQSAGRKALWAISAGLLGFAGMDPFGHLMETIGRDIDAQRSNRDLLRSNVDARQVQANQARSVYEQLSGELGDERAVDLVFENARLNESKARFAKMQADAGLAMLEPTQQQFLSQIDQRIAENELQLDQMSAANPEFFVRSVRSPNVTVLGPDGQTYSVPRAIASQLVGADIKQSENLQTQAVGVAAQGARDASELAGKQAEQQQRGARTSAENKRFISEKTSKARRVRELAQDLLNDVERRGGDVPGVGNVTLFGEGFQHSLTKDARSFRRRLEALGEYDITDLTGAVSSESQQKVIGEFLTSTGLDEDLTLSGLREIQRAMDLVISNAEAVDPTAAAEIRHDAGLSDGGWSGARVNAPAGASSVVEEDE